MITVSIVSHGHGAMVPALITHLLEFPEVTRIVLTCNIPEALSVVDDARVVRINNLNRKGYGANHNEAFGRCDTPYFCVLNPDIELLGNPFPMLMGALASSAAAIAAPLVLSPGGEVEGSVRHFPTLSFLLRKALGGPDGRYAVEPGQPVFSPDSVAGMLMLFRVDAYKKLGGFDEGYFLYYEDVDICRRAKRSGLRVFCCPSVFVIHHAQRASRRSLRHMRWHLNSMLRYLLTLG